MAHSSSSGARSRGGGKKKTVRRNADTLADVYTYLQSITPAELPTGPDAGAEAKAENSRIRHMEIICSSSRRDMGSGKTHVHYRLFDVDPTGRSELGAWPQSTTTKCWLDHATFDTIPVSIPMSIDEHKRRYKMTGVFCSVSCAMRWLMERYSRVNPTRVQHLLHFAANIFGVEATDVRPAPPPSFLKDLGGHLTVDEFRRRGTVCTHLRIVEPPCVSYPMVLEENARTLGRGGAPGPQQPQQQEVAIPQQASTFHQIQGLRRPAQPVPAPQCQPVPGGGVYLDYVRKRDASAAATPTAEDADDEETEVPAATEAPAPKRARTSSEARPRGGLNRFIRRVGQIHQAKG